ncbi:pollen receptor-like kinase 4 [Bidens hawaiensis]|uniref:pollen receptor-like kinase 4 n=1 Tax=Bidens hawaiensis TaxID=980011 RepID=UPI00404A4F1B
MDFSKNIDLARLDLSGNKFDGLISPSLVNLVLLESLQLQENRLSGPIPWFDQSSLKEFNVSNNNLTGPIPNTRKLQSFNPSSYDHNSFLCGPPTSTTCGPTSRDNDNSPSSHKSLIGATLIIVNVIGLVALLMLLMVLYRKNKLLNEKIIQKKNIKFADDKEKGYSVDDEEKGYSMDNEEKGYSVADEEKRDEITSDSVDHMRTQHQGKLVFVDGEPDFELGDLMTASAENLGKGNFGNTYRARLDDGRNVIVKRLKDLKPLSRDEFMNHLKVIAAQKHPNLVPLLAYFYSNDEKLFVHKFMMNGNLFSRLHGARGTRDRIPFRWGPRLAVAQGVARAMEYLHMNPNSTLVPHGNLKSSNVLIDENNVARVSDYGLTSIISNTIYAHQMVAFKSPEYLTSKKVSKKSDVWSYGSLLMELLTGRVSVLSVPKDDKAVDLCSWVHRAVREEWTAEIFDLELMVQRSAIHGMLKLLQLAVRCCDKVPEKRPDMSEVATEIKNIKPPNVDSESEEDFFIDRSLTDDSMSGTPSRRLENLCY